MTRKSEEPVNEDFLCPVHNIIINSLARRVNRIELLLWGLLLTTLGKIIIE